MLLAAALTVALSTAQGQNAYADLVKSNSQLMGYWRFDTVLDGGNVPDELGGGPAVPVGTLTPSDGALGPDGGAGVHCVQSGSVSAYDIATSSKLEATPFTTEFWVRVVDPGSPLDRSLFRQTDTSLGRHIFVGLYANSSTHIRTNFTGNDPSQSYDVISNHDLDPESDWHLLDVVAGQGKLILYIDGTLDAQRVDGTVPKPVSLTNAFTLLCNNDEKADFDELALYAGALDPSEIKRHYETAVAMRNVAPPTPAPTPRTNAFALGCASSPGEWGWALPGLALGFVGLRRRRGS